MTYECDVALDCEMWRRNEKWGVKTTVVWLVEKRKTYMTCLLFFVSDYRL